MLGMEEVQNKIIYLMTVSEKCLKKALSNKSFMKLFSEDEIATFIVKEYFDWYIQYKTIPSMKMIYEKNQGNPMGAKIFIRFKVVKQIGEVEDKPTENEFDAYVDNLRMAWMQSSFTENLNKYTSIDRSKINKVSDLAKDINNFGKQFIKISDAMMVDDEGEYSFTTAQAQKNIDGIKSKDISKEKRFKIGHRKFDNDTNGLRYGDVLMILGNINQGKSMVITNIVYNLWKNGANVLLLTCEMQPSEFDERIYSRATNIDYSSIMNGGEYLQAEDRAALDAFIQETIRRENKIVTKFLKTSDNVNTVESYIEDLKLKHDFVPDVIVVDSLEHISPYYSVVEEKDNLKVAQIIMEFKDFAQTYDNNRGVVVISTHQAKTETFDKKFEDISVTDFGRSKVAAEKPDFAMYIRSLPEFKLMNIKLIKARRTSAGTTWSMAIDFSKALVQDTEDKTNSESIIDD
jgi:archaellum biogenesis ATPase FlaH